MMESPIAVRPIGGDRRAPNAIFRLPGLYRLWTCAYSVPDYIRSKQKWILRRFCERWFLVPCTIELESGARYRLGKDRIADQIIVDLHETYADLYYPDDLQIPSGAIVVDIGGHHGGYAITTLSRFPGTRIVSIEPDPESASLLRQHLELNGMTDRAEVHECGIGPDDSDALLEKSDEGSWGNRVISQSEGAATVSIRLRRLGSILNGRLPYLIKCNCEGGEYYAIPQLLELDLRPKFIILLIHPQEGDADGLLRRVQEAGYAITPVHTSVSHPRYVCRLSEASPE